MFVLCPAVSGTPRNSSGSSALLLHFPRQLFDQFPRQQCFYDSVSVLLFGQIITVVSVLLTNCVVSWLYLDIGFSIFIVAEYILPSKCQKIASVKGRIELLETMRW